MNRLWEQVRDWVLLGSLLLVSVIVLLTANKPMLHGLRARSLEATSAVETVFSGLGRYVRALEENEALRTQNIELSNRVALMRASQAENERLQSLLSLADSTDFELIAARVTSKDITRERNTFVLNVGSVDGVDLDMAVIDSRGIIGKIILVSENYSKVMTYLNADFFAPVVVYPSNSDGIISWAGTQFDRLELNHIVLSAQVKAGDAVVTSGNSAIFQSGYPVGVIDSVFAESGVSTWTIYVTPSASLDDASHVFVVKSRPDPELKTILP
jgi:rod shape-determining protein MreC